MAGWARSLWARGRAGWGAGALCRRRGWMPCGWQGIGVTAVAGVPQPGGTGGSHKAECTAGPTAMMLSVPCVPPAPATCLPGVAVWGGVGINEGLSPWSLQLCPPPPAPALPARVPAASLHAVIAAAPAGVLGPPATHRCVQVGACGEPEGQALPYGAGGPGDCGSLCRVWGWDPCLVTVGAAPGIARTRHSFGSGAESHRPGSCPACIRPGAAGSRPVPPAWHHVPGHPVPSGP